MEPLNDNNLALIEDFLNGQLLPGEAEKVQKRMENDAEFREEVEWMSDLKQLSEKKKAFEVLGTFQEIHQKHKKERRRVRLLAALLVMAVLILVLFILLKPEDTGQQPDETSPNSGSASEVESGPAIDTATLQEIPETNEAKPEKQPAEKPASPPIAAKSGSNVQWDQYVSYKSGIQTLGDESTLGEIKALMDEGKRKAALPLLEKYLGSLTEDEEDFDLRLEAGKIYLKEEKNYEKAAFHFKKVAEGDVILRYKMEAQFYLACVRLAQGQPSEAKKLLQSVAGQSIEPWKSQAERLLEAI